MNIQLDTETIEQLNAMAVLENTTTEALAAQWLQEAAQQSAERVEAEERFADYKANGGIEHDDMMDWLDAFVKGENV